MPQSDAVMIGSPSYRNGRHRPQPSRATACRSGGHFHASGEGTMADRQVRIERDSMGELEVPADALWGASTQRAVNNFTISTLRMPRAFIRALGLIKEAAAAVNRDLGALDARVADAIMRAAREVAAGQHDAQFPVDV